MIRIAIALASLMFAACSSEPDPVVSPTSDMGTLDAISAADDSMSGQDATMLADADMAGAPLVHEAGLCEIPDNPRVSLPAGTDLLKATLGEPNAICNDGSPAVIYVRPAPQDSPNADRWVVWLEGGSACNSPAGCAGRWCGTNGIYTAAKMSSRFAPDGIRGNGIFADRPENSFADWNAVVGYYCSSDNWQGRQRTTAVDESGEAPTYDLYLHGAYIIDELVRTLKAGATSDDGSTVMPSVDDAAQVVLAGTSAGGSGARYNADRVGEMLRETNPSVDYRLLVDAGAAPAEPHPPELSEADALAFLDLKHETIGTWRNGITDQSCLDFHTDDPQWCTDTTHMIVHHITTPWFVKTDLTDSSNSPGPYEDVQTYARVTFELYSNLANGSVAPEEPDVPLDEIGLFIPNCGHHVNLDANEFYGIRITNGTDEVSMHDVLRNWLDGAAPSQALHDPNAGFTSVCP